MTLKEIKAGFVIGQRWNASRIGRPTIVNGNTGVSVIPANDIQKEEREVFKVGSADLVWLRSDGKHLWTRWPKASEILEARPGYLKFVYDNGVVVEFVRSEGGAL